MNIRPDSPIDPRLDVEGEPGILRRGCGRFVFLLVLLGLGLGLLFATGKIGRIDSLAEKMLPWIDSALDATGDTFEPPSREEAPPSAVLDSGQVVVGDFEILSIEEIWESGNMEGTMVLAIEKNPTWLRRLLEKEGIDPNLRLTYDGGEGWDHPLEKAVRQGSPETFEILLEAGSDPNGQGSDGDTALHAAARKGRLEIAQQLVAHGADLDVLSGGQLGEVLAERMREIGAIYEPGLGAAAIERAARNGHADLVAFLLDEGAERRYALHAAAEGGSVEIVQILLLRGADPRVTDMNGEEPIGVARAQGHDEVVALLAAAGVE